MIWISTITKMGNTCIINNATSEYCPLCRSANIRKIGSIQYHDPVIFSTVEIKLTVIPELWECSNCYSLFVQNRVPETSAIALYSSGESSQRWSREEFCSQKPLEQIECLKKYLKVGSKVLDVGCNTGELLDYAKSLGCETSGVEYSQTSREIIKGKGHTAFESVSDIDDKFDVITAFDLIEHLYDVPEFLNLCKKLLRKNGVLIVLTGNIDSVSAKLCRSKWWYIQYPEHICFPSRKFLSEHSGFQIVEWVKTYASKYYQFSWVQIIKRLLLVRMRYNGLPSLGPDHVLVILRNENKA